MPNPSSTRRLIAACVLAVSISAAHPHAYAQAAAPPSATPAPAYDVITIKPNKNVNESMGIESGGDHYAATNVSLRQLLGNVYDIKQDLISGITGPLDSARFDIEAKISEPDPVAIKKMTPEQERHLLLPLLIERFQLKTHTQTTILPVYELVVLPGGPKFKPSADQTMNTNAGTSIHGSPTNSKLTANDIPMTTLAKVLAGYVHRTVIDKTGLTGDFDLILQWSKDETPDAGAESYPTIFTAIQEQLGLKLRGAKGPVQSLVVDQAAMPSDN